jgi:hypothetical protein
MNAKCNDFSVCNDFLYIFTGKTALGLFFLVFSLFFVLSISKKIFRSHFQLNVAFFPSFER